MPATPMFASPCVVVTSPLPCAVLSRTTPSKTRISAPLAWTLYVFGGCLVTMGLLPPAAATGCQTCRGFRLACVVVSCPPYSPWRCVVVRVRSEVPNRDRRWQDRQAANCTLRVACGWWCLRTEVDGVGVLDGCWAGLGSRHVTPAAYSAVVVWVFAVGYRGTGAVPDNYKCVLPRL